MAYLCVPNGFHILYFDLNDGNWTEKLRIASKYEHFKWKYLWNGKLLKIIAQIFRMSGSIELQMASHFEYIQISIHRKSIPKQNHKAITLQAGSLCHNLNHLWISYLNRNVFFCLLILILLLFTIVCKTTALRIASTKFHSDSKLILARLISSISFVFEKCASFNFCNAWSSF